jgi:DNA-binding beta-propeller fold protein YncE
VNTVTNKVYVSNGSTITVIDGKTNATANVTGAGGGAIAVNSGTNRVYVADNNTVTVIRSPLGQAFSQPLRNPEDIHE